MRNLLVVKVHAANIHDTMSGCHVYQAAKNKYSSIEGGCGDAGYRGTFVEFVKVKYGEIIDISEKIKPKEWEILPKDGVLSELLGGRIGRVFYRKVMRLRWFTRKMTL
jgi:putative transposase